MQKLEKLLAQSSKKEKRNIIISYLSNYLVMVLLTMIAFGLCDVTNETLNPTDRDQMIAVFSSVIFIAIICIIFLSWIVSIQVKELINSRELFNLNIRMLGTGKKELLTLYFIECLKIQCLILPIGGVMAEILYFIFSKLFEIQEWYIPFSMIVIATFLYLAVVIVVLGVHLHILIPNQIVDHLRKPQKMIYRKINLIKSGMCLLAGICFIILPIYMSHFLLNEKALWGSRILYLFALLFLFGIILKLVNKIILKLTKNSKRFYLFFSGQLQNSYTKNMVAACGMITFSLTLFWGTQMAFASIEAVAERVVYDNIHYDVRYDAEAYRDKPEMEPQDLYYTLRFHAKTEDDTNLYITGVDEQFCSEYETIKLNEQLSEESALQNIAGNETCNGIILPEFYLKRTDIGKNINVKMGDREVTFKVIGGYYANTFDQLNCFVNKDYLEETMGFKGKYNTVFTLNSPLKGDGSKENFVGKSKMEIAAESRDKAINGAGVVYLVAGIILACAFIALLNYFAIIAQSNQEDIARMRVMGATQKDVILIYILQSAYPVMIGGCISLLTSRFLAQIIRHVTLSNEYLTDHVPYLPGLTIASFAICLTGAELAQFFCLGKELITDHYLMKLRYNR